MRVSIFCASIRYLLSHRISFIREISNRSHHVTVYSDSFDPTLSSLNVRQIKFSYQRNKINKVGPIKNLLGVLTKYPADIIYIIGMEAIIIALGACYLKRFMFWLPKRETLFFFAVSGLGNIFEGRGIINAIIKRFALLIIYLNRDQSSHIWFCQHRTDEQFVRSVCGEQIKTRIVGGVGIEIPETMPISVSLNPAGFTVLMAGRLIETKGVGEFIQIAREVHRVMPNVRFLWAGTREAQSRFAICEKDLDSLNFDNSVEFIGHVDISLLLPNIDLVVFTSHGEGVSKFLCECFASGKAVVAFDTRGLRDVIEDQVSGVLVDAFDISEMVRKITFLLRDKAYAAKLGSNAFSIAKTFMDQDKQNDLLIRLIQDIRSEQSSLRGKKLIFFVTEDWYFLNHRFDLAIKLIEYGMEVHLVSNIQKNNFAKLVEVGIVPHSIFLDRHSTDFGSIIRSLTLYLKKIHEIKPDIVCSIAFKPIFINLLGSLLFNRFRAINVVAGLGILYLYPNSAHFASMRGDVVGGRIMLPVLKALASWRYCGEWVFQNYNDEVFVREKLGIDVSACHEVPGMGSKEFVTRPRISGENLKIVTPARLIWEKGFDVVFKVALACHILGVAAHFYICGRIEMAGPRSVPEEWLKSISKLENISFIGCLDSVWNYESGFDICLLPTRYGEGYPKVLMEAAANGVVCITTTLRFNQKHDLFKAVEPEDVISIVNIVQDYDVNRSTLASDKINTLRGARAYYDTDAVLGKIVDVIAGFSAHERQY